MIASTTERAAALRGPLLGAVGTLVLVLAWTAVAAAQPEVLVPSPVETARSLAGLVARGELLGELAITIARAAVGVAIALTLGIAWGLGAGLRAAVDDLTRPARVLLLGIPPVVPLVLATIWLGSGSGVAVLVVVVVTLPPVAVTVQESARELDRDLTEMARVHQVPPWTRLRHLVLPGTAPALRAAWSFAAAAAVRVTIVVELLAAPDGVGAAIAAARGRLDTAEVFAWALVAITAALLVDRLPGRAGRRHRMRRAGNEAFT
ncbi:MAG: ABC transporter permease [Pseudonocardia sp.]